VSERQVDQETVAIVDQSAEDECRNGYTRASLVGAQYVSLYKLTAAAAGGERGTARSSGGVAMGYGQGGQSTAAGPRVPVKI